MQTERIRAETERIRQYVRSARSRIRTRTNGGRSRIAEDTAVQALRGQMRGEVIGPGDPGYEQARTIWNAMIDRHPSLIARCAGPADVMRCVRFARTLNAPVSIRGGGHNIAGNAVCDAGFMIDLSPMKAVNVNPHKQRAWVGPGACLGDVDHETQAFGLAVPTGINSTTGIAGLTLGGGFGWLSRKHGLTVDNLTAAEVVTADGEQLHADEQQNADLFWALRGGGGNFGIVTNFEFRLHPVGPGVLCGLIVYPMSQARQILAQYREFTASMPEDLNVWVVLRKAPPLPFLPASEHGKPVAVLAVFWAGNPDEGRSAVEPLRRFATPLGEHIDTQPYTAWQAAFDPLLTPGARNYWKSHNFAALSDEAIDVVMEFAQRLPNPQCEVFLGLLGGAVGRIAPEATAYSGRDATIVMNVHGRWTRAAEDETCIRWTRDFFRSAAPHATGGAYVNFLTEDEEDRVRAAYGPNYDRLVEIKRRYDPGNLFRMNHNIDPGAP